VPLNVTINLAVIDRLLINSKRAFLVLFKTAFKFRSSELYHGVSLQVLYVEAPFWKSTFELLFTVNEIRVEL